MGEIFAEECGVECTSFEAPDAPGTWAWLATDLHRIRAEADAAGGRVVALVLDRDGDELLLLENHGAAPGPPVDTVVAVLGGPSGMSPNVETTIRTLLGTV